ncbi:uncharacterized protein [Watersipora subatra]|uniref:uncharacterized protein n=1 Tax=Watersipora subatra TaxID=2589382 RepID=UPI00355B976D
MSEAKCLLLDGGMASQLIANGFSDINFDPLWSARLLSTNPEAVTEAHQAFVKSGADIIETNTYQVSIEGFHKYLDLSSEETLQLVRDSVSLARNAIQPQATGKRILVAGSIGPYGVALHDGSEYTGHYIEHMSMQQLQDWHRPKMKALAEAGIDMFAFETIPAAKEADALVNLLATEFPRTKAMLSFSCKNGLHTNYGEPLSDAVRSSMQCDQITHVGVNCTSPEYIESLLDSLQPYKELKPFVVYPNSGELWTSGKGWAGQSKLVNLEPFISMCIEKGATVIGGCCRVTKETLHQMRKAIDRRQ